jgi:hypothetical protein
MRVVQAELISDEELTAMALAADPGQSVDPSAVPFDEYMANLRESGTDAPAARAEFLPGWYMAPVAARHVGRIPRLIALIMIGSFLFIEAVGLCSAYGQPLFH